MIKAIDKTISDETVGKLLKYGKMFKFSDYPTCDVNDGDIIYHSLAYPEVILNLRFNGVNQDSDPRLHQEVGTKRDNNLLVSGLYGSCTLLKEETE